MRMNFAFSVFLLSLFLFALALPEAEAGTVSGRMLMKNGAPLSGGLVVAFDLQNGLPPAPEKYFRPPDYMVNIESDGSFMLDLPQGEYSIGGVRRSDGKAGPPREGDVYFVLRDDQRNIRRIAIAENGGIDLGDLAAGEIFSPQSDPLHPVTSITGRVVDFNGLPARGITVAAVTEEKGMLFFARETDSNGMYLLRVPYGGTYRIGIWDSGSPEDAGKAFKETVQIDTGETLQERNFQLK